MFANDVFDVLSSAVTIQTGLLTTACTIGHLIVFVASVCSLPPFLPNYSHRPRNIQPSGLHLMFNLPLSKLYTNSVMSSLNSRRGWRHIPGVAPHAPNNRSELTTSNGSLGVASGPSTLLVRHVRKCFSHSYLCLLLIKQFSARTCTTERYPSSSLASS